MAKIITATVIPTAGTQADAVTIPLSDLVFVGAKADKKSNTLKIGEKTYQLNSLVWDVTDLPQQQNQQQSGNNNQQNTKS